MKKINSKEKIYRFLQQHQFPQSRRDFLKLGVLGFSAMAIPWPRFGSALAADANGHVPFLTIDCAGGAGLPGNVLVGGKGGPTDFLSSYSTLGWNPRITALDERFGLPMAGNNVSRILTGMTAAMSAEAQQKFRWASICHYGRNDTNVNVFNVSGLVAKILAKSPLGLQSSGSGGNSQALPGGVNSVFFKDVADINGVFSYEGHFANLKDEDKGKLARGLMRLSQQFSGQGAKEWLAITEGLSKKEGITLDIRLDPNMAAVYGVNAQTLSNSPDLLQGALVKGILLNEYAAGTITIGGCDYHDGSVNTGDIKDEEIGTNIGRAIESAHRLGRPLLIHVITDGGVYSRAGARNWDGDSEDRCLSLLGLYHPTRAPEFPNGMQLGHYTSDKGSSRDTIFGADPTMSGYVAIANYLNLAGRSDLFKTVLGDRAKIVDQLLLFSV